VNDFLEVATGVHGEKLVLEQLVIPKDSRFAGMSLGETQILEKTGTSIAAVIKRDGSLEINPGQDAILEGGSMLIAFGSGQGIEQLSALMD
jgi:K+/H+ antiporter YhaU regulatory subunit KhtT